MTQPVEYGLRRESRIDGPSTQLLHSIRYALLDALMGPGTVEVCLVPFDQSVQVSLVDNHDVVQTLPS